MTSQTPKIQPGVVFYDTFLAGMKLLGRNVGDWGKPHRVTATTIRMAATGGWNGPRAVEIRRLMIEELGRDLFFDLYAKRMAHESQTRGAA